MPKWYSRFLAVLFASILIAESSYAAAWVKTPEWRGGALSTHEAVTPSLVGAFRHTNSLDVVGSLYFIHLISDQTSAMESIAWGALLGLAIPAIAWINPSERQDRWQLASIFRGNRWRQNIWPAERRYSYYNRRGGEAFVVSTYDNGEVSMLFSIPPKKGAGSKVVGRLSFHWYEQKRTLRISSYSGLTQESTDHEIPFDVCPFLGIRYRPSDDGDQLVVIHRPELARSLPASLRYGFFASFDHQFRVSFQSSSLQLVYSRLNPAHGTPAHDILTGLPPTRGRIPSRVRQAWGSPLDDLWLPGRARRLIPKHLRVAA